MVSERRMTSFAARKVQVWFGGAGFQTGNTYGSRLRISTWNVPVGRARACPWQLLSRWWCHNHGRGKGDSADEVAEVNVVVTQSQMGCAEHNTSYSYIKPKIWVTQTLYPANSSTPCSICFSSVLCEQWASKEGLEKGLCKHTVLTGDFMPRVVIWLEAAGCSLAELKQGHRDEGKWED